MDGKAGNGRTVVVAGKSRVLALLSVCAAYVVIVLKLLLVARLHNSTGRKALFMIAMLAILPLLMLT